MHRLTLPRVLIGPLTGLCALGIFGCDSNREDGPLPTSSMFGEVGVFPGQFSYPRAIDAAFDSVFIVDKSARIQRLDHQTGEFLGGFRMPELALGKPTGITVGPHPFEPRRPVLYVADTHYHRIAVYDIPNDPDVDPREPQEPLLTFGTYGTGDGQFVYVTDVTCLLGPEGEVQRLYVTEFGGNDRVSVWRVEGDAIEFEFAFGRFGDGPGVIGTRDVEFQRPQAIEVDHERRELIIADTNAHRLGRFTLDGELIGWVGDGPDEAEFRHPQGFTLLEGGVALVVEFLGNRIHVVDLESGASRGWFGQAGRAAGELASPWGVAVLGRDAMVLDSGNNRVQVMRTPERRLMPPWRFDAASIARSSP